MYDAYIERDSVRMTLKYSNVKDMHVWERESEFSVAFVEYIWTHIKCIRERERERERNDTLLYWFLPTFTSASVLNGTLTSFTMTLSAPIVSLHYFYCYPSVFFSKWQPPNWLIYEIFSKKRGAFKCQMSPFVLLEFPTLIIP